MRSFGRLLNLIFVFILAGGVAEAAGYQTAAEARAAAQVASQRQAAAQSRAKSLDDEITRLRNQADAMKRNGGDPSNLRGRISDLQGRYNNLWGQKTAALNEMRQGFFCTGCGRTRSDILANDPPPAVFPHPGQSIRAATQQELDAKAQQFDNQLNQLNQQIAQLQQQLSEEQRTSQIQIAELEEDARAREYERWKANQEAARADDDERSARSSAEYLEWREKQEAEWARERKEEEARRALARAQEEERAAQERAEELIRMKEEEEVREANAAREAARLAAFAAADESIQRWRQQQLFAQQEAERLQRLQADVQAQQAHFSDETRQRSVALAGLRDAAPVNAPTVADFPVTTPTVKEQFDHQLADAREQLEQHTAFMAGRETPEEQRDTLHELAINDQPGKSLFELDSVKDMLVTAQQEGSQFRDKIHNWVGENLAALPDKILDEALKYGPPTIEDRVHDSIHDTLSDLNRTGETSGEGLLSDNVIDQVADSVGDSFRERVVKAVNHAFADAASNSATAPESAPTPEIGAAQEEFENAVSPANLFYRTAPFTGGRAIAGLKNYLNEAVDKFAKYFDLATDYITERKTEDQ